MEEMAPGTNDFVLVLQGKGGVGKSLIAWLFAQYYLMVLRTRTFVFDADPQSKTLSAYPALSAKPVELLSNGIIDTSRFDPIVEAAIREKATILTDNGASSFIQLTQYLMESRALDLILDSGKRVIINTIVAGGDNLLDTLAGFDWVAQNVPARCQLVVWLNDYNRPVAFDGKAFEETKAYLRNEGRIAAVLRLPKYNEFTFGKDLSDLMSKRLTFPEATANPAFGLMNLQRLKMIERQLLDQVALVVGRAQ